MILRDYWLCNVSLLKLWLNQLKLNKHDTYFKRVYLFCCFQVMSIGFELLEYSLEHQLPNFGECWWDHVRKRLNTKIYELRMGFKKSDMDKISES